MFGEDLGIDVSVLGPGDPEIAVVGGIHGDEPSGVRAVRRVLDAEPALERAVKFVVANPPAAVAHRRFLDADMNRVFPGDHGSDDREERLAAQLRDELDDCTVLSIHATHSGPDPIGFVSREHPQAQEVASRLPLAYVVNHDPVVDGAFTSCECVVSVEAGQQLTEDATENATGLVRAFLRLTDALPDEPAAADPDYYTMYDAVEKPPDDDTYELLVENFERVEAGTTYAKSEDEEFVADEPFSPVLMSETGYDDIFGYKGRTVGETLEAAREAWAIDPARVE